MGKLVILKEVMVAGSLPGCTTEAQGLQPHPKVLAAPPCLQPPPPVARTTSSSRSNQNLPRRPASWRHLAARGPALSVPPFSAHRDLPGRIHALGLGVELVQAVDALEFGAEYLSVQSPANTARGRREHQGSSSAQAPAEAPGGRHVHFSGPLPVRALPVVRELALRSRLEFRLVFRAPGWPLRCGGGEPAGKSEG